MIGFEDAPERFTCSRAGCDDEASWRIDWRNPKIHTAERVKTWLACAAHRGYLEEFLKARNFPVTVQSLSSADNSAETDDCDSGEAG